jgi:hypothetical protein
VGTLLVTRYWTCPKGCGARWERTLVKCRTEGCAGRRPKKRVPVHARTLRDDDYPVYRDLNALIHGPAFGGEWQPDDCGVCGAHPKGTRNMDRDHGHDRSESSFGRPRGLACPGDWGCNKLMSRLTLVRAREIVSYLERVDDHYEAA